MAALLKEKIGANDNANITLVPGLRVGYMVRTEFESEMQRITCKIFANESAAKTYAGGQEVIEVEVIRKFR